MYPPLRPAAYVRVVGARSASDPHVLDQVRTVQNAARMLGWPPPAIYVDIGLPGTHRPGTALNRLTGYLTSDRHDAIIVADLSRLSRDPAEVLAFAAGCIRCGVIIEAVEEGRIDQSRLAALYASVRRTHAPSLPRQFRPHVLTRSGGRGTPPDRHRRHSAEAVQWRDGQYLPVA